MNAFCVVVSKPQACVSGLPGIGSRSSSFITFSGIDEGEWPPEVDGKYALRTMLIALARVPK